MARYHVHAVLSICTGIGLLAIAGVMYQRFGPDLYTLGFVVLGLLALYRSVPPLLVPDRFERSHISRQQLAIDVIGVVLVAIVLYLFVVERAALGDYISV
jgi:hypothetical protein